MYGHSLVVTKDNQEQLRYAIMGPFDGMRWYLAKSAHKLTKGKVATVKQLNKHIIPKILDIEDNVTTLERLKVAPVDSIILLEGNTFTTIVNLGPDMSGKSYSLCDMLRP
jgi:hypothetical protein